MSLVGQCWEDLDAIMDKIMDPPGKAENPRLGESNWKSTDWLIKHHADRGQARGMAILLARFMVPFFRTPDDIAKEAKRRWECRQRGETPQTPGLDSRKYEFPSDDKYKGIREAIARPPVQRTVRGTRMLTRDSVLAVDDGNNPFGKLSEKDTESIRKTKGLMTADELASIYRTNSGMVRKIWGEDN